MGGRCWEQARFHFEGTASRHSYYANKQEAPNQSQGREAHGRRNGSQLQPEGSVTEQRTVTHRPGLLTPHTQGATCALHPLGTIGTDEQGFSAACLLGLSEEVLVVISGVESTKRGLGQKGKQSLEQPTLSSGEEGSERQTSRDRGDCAVC